MGDAGIINMFNWYCGVNSSETLADFTFDLNHTLYNACFTDLIYPLPHLVFIVMATMVLLIFRCCTSIRLMKYSYLIPYPGHYLRWLVYIVLVVLVTGELTEGIMTDAGMYRDTPTRPHLYVPATLSLIATLLSMLYYNQMELWKRPCMSWLLLVFWVSALGGEVIRFLNLNHDPQVDFALMRSDLNAAAIVIYILLILLEINVIRTKILKWCTKVKSLPKDVQRPDMWYLQGYSNFLSASMYSWLGWLYVKGYDHSLECADLGSLCDVHTTQYQSDCFGRALKKEQEQAISNQTSLSMLRIYLHVYGWEMILAFLCRIVADTATFFPPFAVVGIVNYVMDIGQEHVQDTKYITACDFISNGFVLAAVLFVVTAIRGISLQGYYHFAIVASAHVQIALQTAVYDKSMRLATYTLSCGSMTTGQITNHMSVDAMNIVGAFQVIYFLFGVPYLCIGYVIILYYQLSVAALIGFFMIVAMIPISSIVVTKTGHLQKEALKNADDRLKQTNEVFQGIKLIKLYGWEEMFYDAISKVRAAEILTMMKQLGYTVALMILISSCPLLVTLVSYGLFTLLTGLPLTPAIAFGSLTAFGQLFFPLLILPNTLIYTTNAVVSSGRLRAFFGAPEIEQNGEMITSHAEVEVQNTGNDSYKSEDKQQLLRMDSDDDNFGTFSKSTLPTSLTRLQDDIACKIRGSFTWEADGGSNTLNDINLDVPYGKLTMVVGQVGSGKSSLLSALLGEMITSSGSVQWNKNCASLSYGAQKAWLLNTSLRENILFGSDYNEKRYKKVIAACSLQPDIDILPAGDLTEIGEKGINLSGGQKQRVSVARAMYSDNNVVILDDPLSAVDMLVGSHLFNKGIEGFLLRKSKRTVILVTHQVQYAERADMIVVMKDGHVAHKGNLEEIHKENPQLVASWISDIRTDTLETESELSGNESSGTSEERAQLLRQVSALKRADKDKFNTSSGQGRLVEEEDRVKGAVSWHVYISYVKAIGIPAFLSLVLFALLHQTLYIATNYWLAAWSQAGTNLTHAPKEKQDRVLHFYLNGYAGLSVGTIFTIAVVIIISFLFALLASRRLHNQMLKTVMEAPIRFVDITPIGRIMNRFSSDIKTTDQFLGNTFLGFLKYWLNCIGGLVVNVMVTWYFAVALVPFVILYLLLMKHYIRTTRELQRLTSISKSPVYAHFSETLNGLSTIRAYRQQERFRKSLITKIETNNVVFIYLNTSNRWLGARLNLIGGFIVLVASLSTIITAIHGLLPPSLVGLALAYAIDSSNQLSSMIRSSAYLEMQLNSVERIDHYRKMETENYEGSVLVDSKWPEQGMILYEGVYARYATELEPVLHNVSVKFLPGEKVGICGRTGSGKSSLMLALFRMIQMFEGSIFIDGINIANLPLLELRRCLAIIPQDPVLFTGTIRFNLDAQGDLDDIALWEALEIAQLKDVVSNLDLKLNAMVTEGGENFSVGQRQLFCLARAFLRKTRILVMDEATASVDLGTDKIIQGVVATAFRDRTVLTIAHRIQTILDSDRILVLNEGRMAEYDTPENLLAREDSIFASIVKASTNL